MVFYQAGNTILLKNLDVLLCEKINSHLGEKITLWLPVCSYPERRQQSSLPNQVETGSEGTHPLKLLLDNSWLRTQEVICHFEMQGFLSAMSADHIR